MFLVRIRSLRWNYSALLRFAAWRVVPPIVILAILPWPGDSPPIAIEIGILTTLFVLFVLVPVRPCLRIYDDSVEVVGLVRTWKMERSSISAVGLELKNSSFNEPTMYIDTKGGVSRRVSVLAIPSSMFEYAARSLGRDLYDNWERTAS